MVSTAIQSIIWIAFDVSWTIETTAPILTPLIKDGKKLLTESPVLVIIMISPVILLCLAFIIVVLLFSLLITILKAVFSEIKLLALWEGFGEFFFSYKKIEYTISEELILQFKRRQAQIEMGEAI
jgi:hypothetical protein